MMPILGGPNTDMSHSYTNNHVHVVYSTANRKNLIPPEFEKRLYSFVAEIGRENKIPLLAAGGMPNHSHLLFLLPPTMKLAEAVNRFKANSSRFVRKQGIEFNWQTGYGAFAVSASHDECRAYGAQDLDGHITLTFGQPGLRPCHSRRLQIFLLHE